MFTAGRARLQQRLRLRLPLCRAADPGAGRAAIAQTGRTTPGEGWPSWAFENHDAPRALSRWCGRRASRRASRGLKMLLLMRAARQRSSSTRARSWACRRSTCRSSSCRIPKRSPTGRRRSGRDGARTPMPWRSDAPNAGLFDRASRGCRSARATAALAVDRQAGDREFAAAFTRRCLTLRRSSPGAAPWGSIKLSTSAATVAALRARAADGERLLCMFNLSERPAHVRSRSAPTLIATAAISTGGLLGASPR